MDIALCYESVLPARGGCETYISDLARRLVRDGHSVHLYACRWDEKALPASLNYHRLDVPKGPRFLRPWRFARAVESALATSHHDVTMGFDKTWGQDVLYPQGGLHVASAEHNRRKFPNALTRAFASLGKCIDPAAWSFAKLERRQYLSDHRPQIIVNSQMVRRHFQHFYPQVAGNIRVLYSSIDPGRFHADDRMRIRADERATWGIRDEETLGLFVAMNYRLKGLAPLLNAVARMPRTSPFRLAVVGHPKFQRYERQAKRLGILDRVKFVGFRAEPKSAYFAADFLVHPTFYDPCSLVVLEALACGLPITTSRFNGASEFLTPGIDGFVIDDPHNASEFGNVLAKMCDVPRRLEMATAARQTGQRWTFDEHYRQLLSLFGEIAAKKLAA